jgi:hypothetical protein
MTGTAEPAVVAEAPAEAPVTAVANPAVRKADPNPASPAIPTTIHAWVVGGLFPGPEGAVAALRKLRSEGATNDVAGLAVPLDGDPTAPDSTVAAVGAQTDAKPSLLERLLAMIDPHPPRVRPSGWARERVGYLAQVILGDLVRWLGGYFTFRIPAPDGGPGVWVLGRPNHAAAVQGVRAGAEEGPAGAMAAFGVPASLAASYAAAVIGGQTLLTTCETDPGRVARDAKILRRNGARDMFEQPLPLAYGERPP